MTSKKSRGYTGASAEYRLLDSGHERRLEQVGPWRIIRPSPQAIWSPSAPKSLWSTAAAEFVRDASGRGRWKGESLEDDSVVLNVEQGLGQLLVRATDFGHLGFFPEHFAHWRRAHQVLSEAGKGSRTQPRMQVLHLFAYTGGGTLACVKAGAQVTHVDASEAAVVWARKNADRSKIDPGSVRWLVEDARKFVKRELRRGQQYDAFILDPPSFGRGSKGEVWKIESDLGPLLSDLAQLASPRCQFLLLSAHSPGVTGLVLENLLRESFSRGRLGSEEMWVAEHTSHRRLPAGQACWWLPS